MATPVLPPDGGRRMSGSSQAGWPRPDPRGVSPGGDPRTPGVLARGATPGPPQEGLEKRDGSVLGQRVVAVPALR
jgi:hypothetical protein